MEQFTNGTSVVVAECDKSSETAYFWFREAVDVSLILQTSISRPYMDHPEVIHVMSMWFLGVAINRGGRSY